jgi:hypothetical protein
MGFGAGDDVAETRLEATKEAMPRGGCCHTGVREEEP